MKPADFHITEIMIAEELVGALGKAEAEWAATLVIAYHQRQESPDWVPVTRAQIAEFLKGDPVCPAWANNPFWRPDPWELGSRGYITGWQTPDEPGTFTPAFFAAVEAAMDKRGARGGRA